MDQWNIRVGLYCERSTFLPGVGALIILNDGVTLIPAADVRVSQVERYIVTLATPTPNATASNLATTLSQLHAFNITSVSISEVSWNQYFHVPFNFKDPKNGTTVIDTPEYGLSIVQGLATGLRAFTQMPSRATEKSMKMNIFLGEDPKAAWVAHFRAAFAAFNTTFHPSSVTSPLPRVRVIA